MSSSKPIRTDRLYSLLAQRPAVVAYVNERETFVKELALRLTTPEDLTAAYDQLLALDLNDTDLRDAATLLSEAAAIAG